MIILKILLYILLFIVAVVGVLLTLRLKLYITMTDSLCLRAGLGPIVLTLVPSGRRTSVDLRDFTYEKHAKRLRREKRKRERRVEAAKKKKLRELCQKAEQTSVDESTAEQAGKTPKKLTLEAILELVEFVLDEFPRFTSYIQTEIRELDIAVARRDAADCAKRYGVIAQLVSYLLELLDEHTSMKPLRQGAVAVRADFLAEKTVYRIDLRIRLRLFSIVRVGFHTLVWFIRSKLHK